MKRYLSLIGQIFVYSLKGELEFRTNTLVYIAMTYVWVFTSYIVLRLVFGQAGTVAGWTIEEVILLVLVYYVNSTVVRAWVVKNMVDFVEKVRKGGLDYLLLKPVDTQFLVSFSHINVLPSFRSPVMLVALILYIRYIQLPVSPEQVLLAIATSIAGIIGLYSVYFLIATSSLVLENLWNIDEVFFEALEISKHPTEIYPGALRNVFMYVIPMAGVAAVPAMALLGKLSVEAGVLFIATTSIICIFTRILFYRAIRRYSSVSS